MTNPRASLAGSVCSWRELCTDVHDIIWGFCGDLRCRVHRLHRFAGAELKCWVLMHEHRRGSLRASNIKSDLAYLGGHNFKAMLDLQYVKAQREGLLAAYGLCSYKGRIGGSP